MFQVKLINTAAAGQPQNLKPYYEVVGQFDLQGQADLICNPTLQNGYQELTDISILFDLFLGSWGNEAIRYVHKVPDKSSQKRIDWKYVRDYIKAIVNNTGFDNLDNDDKIVAAKCNIGTRTQQEAVLSANFTIEKRQEISFNYDYNVAKTRKVRASEIISAFWQFTGHLIVPSTPYPIPAYILTSLITIASPTAGEIAGDLVDLFENKGLQGIHTAQDGILGIYDFIQSTTGTRFETTGLSTNVGILASGTPSGFANWTTFKDYIFDIIHNGNY